MNVDEIDTILCHDESQFYSKITYKLREINMIKKFSSLWNHNVISTFVKKLI